MAFDFKNLWKGGALGKLGDAVVAIQAALEGMKSGNSIIIQKNADNSVKISYAGPTARNGWNGKMYKPGAAAPIMNVDVTDPANILDEYVCANLKTWSTEWASADKDDPDWVCYHVAEPWGADVDEEIYGSLYLLPEINGAIHVPADAMLPDATVEKNILSAEKNLENPGKFIWQEAGLTIEANAEAAQTGFVFAKPDPAELPVHSQMKLQGATAAYYLCSADGVKAHWVQMPSPIITGIDINFKEGEGGGSLVLEYTLSGKEIQADGTWQDKTYALVQKVVVGGTCGDE